VIVDFWAEWCGPCHAVSPVLDKIAEERADELKLVKYQRRRGAELMIRYGVKSIPTIFLFKDGAPAASVIGAQRGRDRARPRPRRRQPPSSFNQRFERLRHRDLRWRQARSAPEPAQLGTSSAARGVPPTTRRARRGSEPSSSRGLRRTGQEGAEPLAGLDLEPGLLEQLARSASSGCSSSPRKPPGRSHMPA
jgi:thioredoxin